MLTLRCPTHPAYNGSRKPGESAMITPTPVDPARGAQNCADCWELFRLVHEDGPVHP